MEIEKIQRMYIGGDFYTTKSAQLFTNSNPATAEQINEIEEADAYDVDHAVKISQEALKTWKKTTYLERARILQKTADLLRENNERLAQMEVLDTGKPIQEAIAVDILSGADVFEYYAGLIQSMHGHYYDLGQSFAFTRREPLGVVGAIGAWNYPLQIACWKAAPALACGNTVLFKPSECTPLTAVALAQILTKAGLPSGVFNVLQGRASVGKMMSSHPGIQKISLTGSVPTGKKVLESAASTLKKVTLELGGKSPLLIFADCDLEQAVHVAMLANFYTQGEICSNGTRVFVHENVYEKFLQLLKEKCKSLKIDNPMLASTQVGALINLAQWEKVQNYIQSGIDQGAKLLFGGLGKPKELEGTPFFAGHFARPTVFYDCHDSMQIVKEEIFGPVMSVLKFQDEEEVISRANATDFGLAAGVMTLDIQRGHRVAAALEAGICWINNYNITPVQVPFGGYKNSGLGRENGIETLNYYSQTKTIYVEQGVVGNPYPM